MAAAIHIFIVNAEFINISTGFVLATNPLHCSLMDLFDLKFLLANMSKKIWHKISYLLILLLPDFSRTWFKVRPKTSKPKHFDFT